MPSSDRTRGLQLLSMLAVFLTFQPNAATAEDQSVAPMLQAGLPRHFRGGKEASSLQIAGYLTYLSIVGLALLALRRCRRRTGPTMRR